MPSSSHSPKQFFVLALPRSGSTWLQQTLNAHPDVTCLFEPTELRFVNKVVLFLREHLRIHATVPVIDDTDSVLPYLPVRLHYSVDQLEAKLTRASTPLVGAKLALSQVLGTMDFAAFFMRYQHARFILLDRASIVDAMCSFTIARRTQVWFSNTYRKDTIAPFEIDAKHAEHYILSHLLYWGIVREFTSKLEIPVFETTYEKLMTDTQNTLSEMADFLEVSPFQTLSALKQLRKGSYKDIITNYDALQAFEETTRQRLGIH